MLDVVGVGTNSVDEVLQLPIEAAAVLAGGKVRVSDRRFLCGGQTATVVAACAALGLRSGYLGAFGSDEHGRLIRNALKSCGVDVRGSIECDAPNRGAVILVDPQGNRTVLWHRSDRLKVPFQELRASALQGRVVHVDDDDPELALHAATIARSAGTPVTSDLEHVSDRVEQLIASVTFPIFEQNLPAQITGERDPERALRKLRRLNDGLLVMTRGDQGAVALDGDTFHVAPAFEVKVGRRHRRRRCVPRRIHLWVAAEMARAGHASLRERGRSLELHEARRDTVGAHAGRGAGVARSQGRLGLLGSGPEPRA